MNLTRTFALASVFAAALTFASCGATAELKGKTKMPLPGGGHIEGEVTVGIGGDKDLDLKATRPVCVKLCYSSSTGANLGCFTVEVPASSQVPAGAVSVTATIVPCPESGGGGGGGNMFDPGTLPQQVTQGIGPMQGKMPAGHPGPLWEMIGLTLVPSATGAVNVNFSFGIRAWDLEAAEGRRDNVLLGGIGTQTGPDFNICFYSETEAKIGPLGVPIGVWVRQAEVHDTFYDYMLRVNGTVVADLATSLNTLHYPETNGWDVVEALVPTSAFDTGSTFSNAARSDWNTINNSNLLYATSSLTNL